MDPGWNWNWTRLDPVGPALVRASGLRTQSGPKRVRNLWTARSRRAIPVQSRHAVYGPFLAFSLDAFSGTKQPPLKIMNGG